MQREILLSRSRPQIQSLGNQLPRLHCQQTNRYETNTMLSNTEFPMGPEDCLERNILPILPSSNGYQHIITMTDVFSRYLFTYPTQDMTAKTVARCIIDVMTRHCYLPTVILTNKGSQFRSVFTRHTDKPRIDETCPNNRHTRKNSRFSKNFAQNINGRETIDVAHLRVQS